jgi:diguanylate cyclase (GGDEF)-like protein
MPDGTSGLTRRLYQLHELHFTLSEAATPDEVCRLAVELGREPAGVDRIGIWFKAEDNPEEFIGSYGIDEKGNLRDERSSRIPRNTAIYDDDFFSRKVPFRYFPDSPVFDNGNNPVGTADLIVAPLWNGDSSIGAFSADNFSSRRKMTEDDRHLVTLLARMVAHLVTMKRTEEALREKTALLEELATTDALTGFLNRRTGIQNLEHHIAIVRRHGGVLTVAFLDIDHLKKVNDEQGHGRGDLLIRTVAELLRTQLREADVVCRMGGDEFMIVLPENTAADARLVMNRLAEAAGNCKELAEVTPGPWFSFGISEYRGSEDGGNDVAPVSDVAKRLIHDADMEMYIHKRSMRRA